MPTASELVDNRAIVARIHRRNSSISQFEDDEDDSEDDSLIVQHQPQEEDVSISYHHRTILGVNTALGSEQDRDEVVGHPPQNIPAVEGRTYQNNIHRRGGGKWPKQKYLFNSSSVMQSGYRKRKCDAHNCVHQYGNSCADILLRPQLYPHICRNKAFTVSSNPLLEYCLDGAGQLKSLEDKVENNKEEQLPPLLALCSNFSSNLTPNISFFTNTAKENEQFKGRTLDNSCDVEGLAVSTDAEQLNRCEDQSNSQVYQYLESQLICQAESGCDINVQNSQGFTALHFLINGCSKENFPYVLRAVSLLTRQSGINVSLEDIQGNTPFNAIHNLLQKGLYRQSFLLAKCLLQASSFDVNHVNAEGRSLLSYSVCHGDMSIDLSRHLLNNGAKIFPTRANNMNHKNQNVSISLATERDQSAFTWFLQSVMEAHSLQNTDETVRLVCQGMAEDEESPSALKEHVLSTMVHVGKYGNRTCAPLFVELKKQMSIYWRLPQPLTYHCLKTIRKSLRPKNPILSQESISEASQQLNLPSRIMSYLQLN